MPKRSIGLVEGLIAVAAFATAAVFAYGRHITDGGLHFDDWRTIEAVGSASLFDAGAALEAQGLNARPLQTVYLWFKDGLLGLNTAAQLLFTALAAGTASAALYALLRIAGVARVLAAGAGALLLVFPFAVSTRVWAAGGSVLPALTLALAGGCCALRGLQGPSRRWAVAAAVLYALAVLQYEHALALVGPLLAFTLIAGRSRAAAVMVGVQAVATAAAAAVIAGSGEPSAQPDAGGALRHFGRMLEQSVEVLGRSLTPIETAWPVGVVAAVLVVLAGAVAARRSPGLRAPLALVAAGASVVIASYVVLAPASDYYAPLAPGQGDRSNSAAQVGFALIVAGLAGVAAGLARSRWVALVLIALVGLHWTARTSDSTRAWDDAWTVQQDVLAAMQGALGAPEPFTSVLAFGVPRGTDPEVPVFVGPEDLGPALRIRLGVEGLGAVPVQGETRVVCAAEGPVTEGGFIAPQTFARYGRTFFFDYAGRRALPVPDRRTCRELVPGLAAGPLTTG